MADGSGFGVTPISQDTNTFRLSTSEDAADAAIEDFTASHPGTWLATYVDEGDRLIVILRLAN